jgi:cytochrome c-type biogenesis protein CcmH
VKLGGIGVKARTFLFIMAALLGLNAQWVVAQALDAQQEARFVHLAGALRCLVCQNQSILESHADLANDLKVQLREMLAAGKSDTDINDYMVARYGDFVLYEPPLKGGTVVLWLGPAVLLIATLAGFVLALRRRKRSAPDPLDEADRNVARELLGARPQNEGADSLK